MHLIAGIIDDIDIGAGPAAHLIGARAAIEDIRRDITLQRFVGVAAIGIGLILADAEIDGLDSLIDQEIDAGAGFDDVVGAAIGDILIGAIPDIIESIGIVAGAADQEIGALEAIDRIVAGAAIDHVVLAAAGNRLAAAPAGETPARLADISIILDVQDGAHRNARLDHVAGIFIALLVDDIEERIDEIDIVAGAALENVVALAAVERVLNRRLAIEDSDAVVERIADHGLRVAAGHDDIVDILQTGNRIGALGEIGRADINGIDAAALQIIDRFADRILRRIDDIGIVAGTADHLVVAETAIQIIVAGAAIQTVIAVAAA